MLGGVTVIYCAIAGVAPTARMIAATANRVAENLVDLVVMFVGVGNAGSWMKGLYLLGGMSPRATVIKRAFPMLRALKVSYTFGFLQSFVIQWLNPFRYSNRL